MNKSWCTHTVEYYSAIKGMNFLICATTWMNLENMLTSEISETQKDKNCMIPLIGDTGNRQTHRDRM